MKKNHIINAFLLILLAGIVAACANKYYSKAMSQIKKNNVTQATIKDLKEAAKDEKCKIESLYQLARIYHYNQSLQDLEKAHQCYQILVNSSNDPKYNDQFDKLAKKQNVSKTQINKYLSEVEVLIDNNEYNSAIKTNTINGYKDFVFKHPYSKHLNDAKDKAFKKAKEINTYESFAEFMSAFPDRSTSAKDEAFNLAKRKNTIADYKTYLNTFNQYKLNEVDEMAYAIAKKTGTVAAMDEYMSSIPSAKHKNEATLTKEQIIFKDFISSEAHKSKSFKDKIDDLDSFIAQHNSETYKECANMYFDKIAPSSYDLNTLKAVYNDLTTIHYSSESVKEKADQYLSDETLSYVEGSESLPNVFIKFDGGSYSSGWNTEETQNLKEESNINMTSVTKTLNNRITRCNTAKTSFPLLSDATKEMIDERANRDKLFIQYYPVKHFYDNMDKQTYNEKTFQSMLNTISNIQNNAHFRRCGNFLVINQVLNDAARKINNKKDEANRNKLIAANSVVKNWKLGNEVCKSINGGIIYGTVEQFNDDRSSIQVKILAGPSGEYNGQSIKKENTIWIQANEGWHKCLPDEKEYALNHNTAKSINEPNVIYQESSYSGPTVCSQCGGRGRVVCSSCDGTGIYESWGGDKSTCSSCKGSGYYRCYNCGGRGVL